MNAPQTRSIAAELAPIVGMHIAQRAALRIVEKSNIAFAEPATSGPWHIGDDRLPSRFWDKVAFVEGCWIWTGAFRGEGYPNYYDGTRTRIGHRVAYEHLVGPIPDGYQVDHLCKVRLCVNPHHLEAVTARVNTLRSTSPSALRSQQTHCKNGHLLPEERFLGKRWMRRCLECYTVGQAAYKARKKLSRANGEQFLCQGCDAGRHEPRQFCEMCNDVTDSYPAVGGGL